MARASRLAALAFALAGSSTALAQGVGPDEPRLAAAARLEQTRGARVRWDDRTGTPASVRFAGGSSLGVECPEQAAARLLEGELLALYERDLRVVAGEVPAPLRGTALVLRGTRDLGCGRVRVDFDEVVGGVPVRDASLQVELARTEQGLVPVSVVGRYEPGVPSEVATAPLGPAREAARVRFPDYEGRKLSSRTTTAPAIVREGAGYRLALVVHFLAGSPPAGVEAILDAATGRELSRSSLAVESNAQGLAYGKNPLETPRAPFPLGSLYVFQGGNRVTTDAAGNHPLTGTVTLDQALSGPLCRVFIDSEPELVYSGPADVNLQPDETSSHQDEVAAFHHVASYSTYFQTTYPGGQNAASVRYAIIVRAKKNGQPFANAFFTTNSITALGETFPGYIALGTWGANESARSSTVVRHEYTHAILQNLANLHGTLEAGGINEGLADYFPCAQQEDSRQGIWLRTPYIRDLSTKLVWPADNNGDVHRAGNIFAGALWQARTAAEARRAGDRLKLDQAVFAGVVRYRGVPTLVDAREATIEGDKAVNKGANVTLLEQAFFDHGIGPAPAHVNQGPTIAPLSDKRVAAGATLTVKVTAQDPDGDPVTLSASALPGATFDARTGTLTYRPDASQTGPHRETFTASDGQLSTSATITITVDPAATTPPVAPPVVKPTVPPVVAPPVLAPVTSQVSPGSTAKPATGFASGSGGGGGGGCALSGTTGSDPSSLGPYALALLALALVRRRR